jgi:hypothetical protein
MDPGGFVENIRGQIFLNSAKFKGINRTTLRITADSALPKDLKVTVSSDPLPPKEQPGQASLLPFGLFNLLLAPFLAFRNLWQRIRSVRNKDISIEVEPPPYHLSFSEGLAFYVPPLTTPIRVVKERLDFYFKPITWLRHGGPPRGWWSIFLVTALLGSGISAGQVPLSPVNC